MKNITVITGSRAEYGLLKPLIKRLRGDSKIKLNLVVTGMHLSPEFGNTYKEIEEDGIEIICKIDTLVSSDNASGIAKSMGIGLISMADYFNQHTVDLLIVLGDRTEILAACTAAMVFGIPIAHSSGGETTEGAYDEAIRHAITKMSYLHFPSTELYAKRIIQLGENPSRVFNVGAIGIDSIKEMKLMSRLEFQESIGFILGKKNILITFHPVTLENNSAGEQFEALLGSLKKLSNTCFIFTKPNSDKGGRVIIQMIDEFVKKHPETSVAFKSLGHLRYLSALQYMDLVIGNSSSGLVEVPSFEIPTINIGDRQKGRIMPESVISCAPDEIEIDKALEKAFSDKFRKAINGIQSPYGSGNTAIKIHDIISWFEIDGIKKEFYDV